MVESDQTQDKNHLFRNYGSILGTEISPLSIFTARYFNKNYGKALKAIPERNKILEIGPGNASFTQYLLYKGYRDITVCEMAADNAKSLDYALGNRIKVVHSEAISYLEDTSDTFDLIYAGQVIEHFIYDDFIRFLAVCYTSLEAGGYLIFETINCANIIHGLYLRYCDYTHRMGFTPRSLMHFLMATGDFSRIDPVEVRPPGLLDCLYSAFHKLRGHYIVSEIKKPETTTRSNSSRGLISILSKTFIIRFSRWLSLCLLKYYEFEKLNIYTPFFAIIAQK